ncbi:SURF1 family protein [Verticiella sediminum]|uniref:SURF1-like protein n=2 Tax=Verticiella sediminum TaxID=1247510 RepID=A0A556AKB5_9BURK|nr:SURF1 family protein [Verticiella sediminum]
MRGWRLWLALVALLAIAAVCLLAGRWQLSRSAEKTALADAMASAAAQAPLALTPAVAQGTLGAWRPATAAGAWQPGYTVLLDNRNHDGAPGRWVATPLCLGLPDAPDPAEGEAVDCDRAVLVLRGWQPRERPGEAPALPPPPVPGAPVEGRLLEHVPRLFELSALTPGEPAPAAPIVWEDERAPVLQNLTVAALADATGLPLLPMVLEQRNDTGDGLLRDWPSPVVDVAKHKGYALQWFAFAAIALIALGVIVVKAFRNRNR